MKIVIRIQSLFLILFLLLISMECWSQVVVERSVNKVVISGVPYYIHIVKKGETAYQISRTYGIKVEELVKENPPALYGVNEGQSLRIPANSVTEAAASGTAAATATVPAMKRDEAKFIYHKLNPGETIYFLSKSYGVSENEIIHSNAGIDINKLSVGAEIAIPRVKFMNERQTFEVQDKKYIYHKVRKGESLASIAEKYGLTVRELRKQNRDLRFPQTGDFVRVPLMNVPDIQEVAVEKADSVIPPPEEPVKVIVRPAGITPVKELTGSLDVAVLLPFYLKENADRIEIDSSRMLKGKRVYKEVKRPEDWIYPGSLDFVEMYEGILLAADTLRSLGLNINLYTHDIRSDTMELSRLITSGKLSDMDLIIGPVYSHNLVRISDYAKHFGIPVVSPVPLYNNTVLSGNPNLFMASSSLEVAQKTLAKKVSEYADHNFVFIHADTLGTDDDVKRFKSLIMSELSSWMPYEEIKFKEFVFFSRSMFDNDSINRLGHALSDQTENVVIIASEDAPVISETIMDVHGLSKKFAVKVFGYPIMRDIENLDPHYYFDLDILVYSPSWIDYTKNDVKKFNADFRMKFLSEPSEKSYAWSGYDIAYYFISGLALHGKDFILSPAIHRPDLLHTEFDFVNKTELDGFENHKLYLIHYTKDFDVTLAGDKKPSQ